VTEEISWTFYGYETPAGGRDVQDWYDALLPEERDEARDVIGYLHKQPLRLWKKPGYCPLGDGLSEVRFRVNALKKIYRVYGFFWPRGRRLSYTFLLAREKKVSNPRHDIAEARARKARLEQGEASEHEFEFQERPNSQTEARPEGS
jgi:hypothetical protein